ncbi:nucleoside transporter-domain-containing protein [Collybia nuda]|uniref:Nucleoside transporter-domain-containing protein n=1 Tax=Collybia nuda TaxID=64659 RepID=A0A9P5YGM4_9AGAR|nr:nucleoside transporter-domain-containing protein [Collybia nuda]
MSSPSSPEVLYHAIPQALVNENHAVVPSDIELDADGEEAESGDLALSTVDPPTLLVDSRIRWIHFVLGCSVLLPWNVIITATPFFVSRLENSPLKRTFSSYLSVTFTAANFVFLAHATAVSKQTSPSRQTRITIFSLTILTFLLTLSTFFRVAPGIFFTFVLLNGATQATAGAYLQTSLIAVASLFGPTAVQSMMSGQAAVAVAVSAVQVISAAAFLWGKSKELIEAQLKDGSAEERSAFVFFALSTVFLVVSAAAHTWLVRMPIYRRIAAPLEQHKVMRELGSPHERQALTSVGRTEFADDKAHIMRIAKTNITYHIAVAYVFVVTLAVFPPITVSVQPTNPNTHPLLFSAAHFLVFNLGDFLGRYICSFPSLLIWSAKRLLTLSLARTLFVPLFLMCNVQRPLSSIPSSPIINSDLLFMLILFAFGLSNGYVSSLCMMSAPSLEHNPRLKGHKEDVDVAATVASFCLVGGLAIGSVANFAVRGLVCECNPFTE